MHLMLSELLRAGWQFHLLPPAPGEVQATLLWQRTRRVQTEDGESEIQSIPVMDGVSVWALEYDLSHAIESFYKRVFPISKDGLET